MTISCSLVWAYLLVNLSMSPQERPAWGHRMLQRVLVASTCNLLVEVEQVGQPSRDQRRYLAIRAIHRFPYGRGFYRESMQAWSTKSEETLGSWEFRYDCLTTSIPGFRLVCVLKQQESQAHPLLNPTSCSKVIGYLHPS